MSDLEFTVLEERNLERCVILRMRCRAIPIIDHIIESLLVHPGPENAWSLLRSLTLKTECKREDIEDVAEILKSFDTTRLENVVVDLYLSDHWTFFMSHKGSLSGEDTDSCHKLEQVLLQFPRPRVAVSFEKSLHYCGGYVLACHRLRTYFPALIQRGSLNVMPAPRQFVVYSMVCRTPTDIFEWLRYRLRSRSSHGCYCLLPRQQVGGDKCL